MVVFEQLRIADDGQTMYIDAHVHESEKGTYLSKLYIATPENASETSFSGISDPEKCIYWKEFEEGETEVHLVLNVRCLDSFRSNTFSNNLFFVFIEDSGTTDECIPCPIASNLTVAVTFDETIYYQMVMGYTKELADTCQVSQGFTDFILKWNALKAAIETEHWVAAIKFWEMLFGGIEWDVKWDCFGNGTSTKHPNTASYTNRRGGCGCHG